MTSLPTTHNKTMEHTKEYHNIYEALTFLREKPNRSIARAGNIYFKRIRMGYDEKSNPELLNIDSGSHGLVDLSVDDLLATDWVLYEPEAKSIDSTLPCVGDIVLYSLHELDVIPTDKNLIGYLIPAIVTRVHSTGWISIRAISSISTLAWESVSQVEAGTRPGQWRWPESKKLATN